LEQQAPPVVDIVWRAGDVRLASDSVEKVRSRSMKEIRPNDDAIFGLICLPPQIDYGRLGLTAPCIMRSPASV